MTENYVLFFSHTNQIAWFSIVAGELRHRLGLRAVMWVIGPRDHTLAASGDQFDEVVDLLRGFDLSRARAEYSSNLAYLATFEARRGQIFYQEAVAIDRYVSLRGWSPAETAHYAVHLLKAMERRLLLEGGLPLCAMGENNTLPYRMAHHRLGPSVPYWYIAGTRQWDDRFHLDPDAGELWPECRRRYAEYRNSGIPRDLYELARERLQQLRQYNVQPLYTQVYTKLGHRGSEGFGRKLKLHRVGRVLREYSTEVFTRYSKLDPQVQTARALSPASKVKRTLQEEARKRFFDQSSSLSPPRGVNFATYFLHVQPEYSVEGYAFEFRDQLTLIENIAAALPADCHLVVKEHKPMVGMRPAEYYKRLMRIPNVTLLTDRYDSYELIRGSKIVFTLSGTSALIALYEDVPAIVFGDIYFDSFEGIHQVKSFPQLKEAIARVLSDSYPRLSEDAKIAALAAMYSASFPGKFGEIYTEEEMRESENLRQLMDPIENELMRIISKGRAHERAIDQSVRGLSNQTRHGAQEIQSHQE